VLPVRIAVSGREQDLADVDLPLELLALLGAAAKPIFDWEVEIGFGKGRYLLEQAQDNPECGFLGIEVASKYYRHVRDRATRDHVGNLVLMRGEARYLLAAVLPVCFARSVHVYFPDPWPKSRHHGRRLFDPESLDLLLRLLKPGGVLSFATDYLDYGELVGQLLRAHPALEVSNGEDLGDPRPRTHYEDKYLKEGRPILRFAARLTSGEDLFHPLGSHGVVAAVSTPATSADSAREFDE
jgi:tRNA (guanine-N7-)-methyltransferase